jgi:hypothetical protein
MAGCSTVINAVPVGHKWGPHILILHIAVNIRFLITIFAKGSANGFRRVAGTRHTSQTHCSLHIKVLLVKFKIMYLNTFFILHLV